MKMKIETFPSGQLDTNSYLVYGASQGEAVLVDAPFGSADQIMPRLKEENLKLRAVLITHGHWDHIGDAAKISAACQAPIIAGTGGKQLIENPEFQTSRIFGHIKLEKTVVSVEPKDGDILEYAGFKIKCLEVPGHCPGSLAFIFEDEGKTCAFVGDLIFEGSVGRTDLWGGDFPTLEKSVKKIYELPDSTVIYPGHGYPTSVGVEKTSNPFVRG